MVVDPTSGMGRLTDLPRLKSSSVRSSETSNTAGEARSSGKFMDPVSTDSGFSAYIRQSSAQFQETQGRVTRARLGLAGLDEVQSIFERSLSPATRSSGIRTMGEAASEVERVVTRVSFEGEPLLTEFKGILDDETRPPRELLNAGLRLVSEMRKQYAEELQTEMVRLGELQVERANRMAASGARAVTDARDATALLRQVLESMNEDQEAVQAGLNPENFVRFV